MSSAINQTIFTASDEIALITRIEHARDGEPQIYGVFCTGDLVDSLNAAGEPNEFLLTLAEDEDINGVAA